MKVTKEEPFYVLDWNDEGRMLDIMTEMEVMETKEFLDWWGDRYINQTTYDHEFEIYEAVICELRYGDFSC